MKKKNTCGQILKSLRPWLSEISTIILTLSPGLENNDTSKYSSINFPGIIQYVSVPEKFSEIHLHLLLFSNQGDTVLILDESTGQICHRLEFNLVRISECDIN